MITNIIVGGICFIVGMLSGMVIMTKKMLKAATLYKETTGNDFIKWIQETSSKKQRECFDKAYGSQN